MMPPVRRLTLLPASLLALLTGCGSPGAPQPPSLKIPTAVADLSASRTAYEVHLHWTMPRRATDRVLLTGDQRVLICRNEHAGPCQRVGRVLLQPGAAADYTDRLPPALSQGAARLLTYSVELTNRSGHAAGPSNPAYSAAGSPPPAPERVSAEATARGIVLRWAAAPGEMKTATEPATLIRIRRTRILEPGESPRPETADTREGVPQPLEQTLELTSKEATRAVDADALLDRRYLYQVQRVAKVTLDGHSFEVSSAPGTAEVAARDLFPPAMPQGLAAVADNDAGAIDLSWNPNAERDLAGYFVYRRTVGGRDAPAGAWVRVSGAAPLEAPAWRDAAVERGVRYSYAVSAVDRDGNESPRSEEAGEGLASPP